MKKLFPVFLMLLAGVSISFAQTLKITPKKTVYTRRGKVSFREKRTFVVTYPTISGALPPATKRKLEKTISYWRIFDTTLAENLSDYDWLSEMSYQVNYNRNGILDIALTQEGSGAYPDQSTINVVIDTKTGNEAKFSDVFKPDSLGKFAEIVDAKLKVETKEIMADIDKGGYGLENGKEYNDSMKADLAALTFSAETFNEFSISDKGITILYDAGFPHATEALQPSGRYFFSWSEAKPFIRRDGLLGKFVS